MVTTRSREEKGARTRYLSKDRGTMPSVINFFQLGTTFQSIQFLNQCHWTPSLSIEGLFYLQDIKPIKKERLRTIGQSEGKVSVFILMIVVT